MNRPRLKSPRGQQPRDDLVPHPAGPSLVRIEDPAELLYQAYAKKLDHRGPQGRPLRLWHELANKERKAWRAAFAEFAALQWGGQKMPVPLPGEDQVVLGVATGNSFSYDRVLVRDMRSITDFRAKVKELLDEAHNRDLELHHE